MSLLSPLLRVGAGIGFFWLFYGWFAFIAFSIFERHSNGFVVFGVWLVTTALIGWWLWRTRFITWATVGGIVLMFSILAGLYFVPPDDSLPPSALALNRELSAQHQNRYEYARALFKAMERKWTSPTRQYLLEPHKVFFIRDFNYFWQLDQKYVDSNTQAQMYERLLEESGRFDRDEVYLDRKGCINSPHTVVVLEDGRKIYADFWAADYFAPQYRFGQFTTVPCVDLQGDPF